MRRGTIVLTPFPFTNLQSQKIRPALVVSSDEIESDDVILAFISSVIEGKEIKTTDLILKKDDIGFKETGLKVDSILRLGKLATIYKKIILGEIGYLPEKLMKIVNKKLKI